jgi:hypothetical protein
VTSLARAQTEPEWRPLKTGLIGLAPLDFRLRVVSVFTEPDERSVPITVRFIAANNVVLLEESGEVRDGQPFEAMLISAGVNDLVRIEVIHEMTGCRQRPYPIVVTIQPYFFDEGRVIPQYVLERPVNTSCLP